MNLKKYVQKQFSDIPDCERKHELIGEIVENLQEKVDDLVLSGKSEEDAVNKVLVDFGDMTELKKEFVPDSKRSKTLSLVDVLASLVITLLFASIFVVLNLKFTPNSLWFPYVLFGVLWIPFILFFVWQKKLQYTEEYLEGKKTSKLFFWFALGVWAMLSMLLLFINLNYTPTIMWSVYPILALAIYPITTFLYYQKKKYRKSQRKNSPMGLLLSVSIWALLSGILLFTNLRFTPGTLWCIFPVLGIALYPVIMLYIYIRKRF